MNLQENEVAKHIIGYEGKYMITNLGRVWSIVKHKFNSIGNHTLGYKVVNLKVNGKQKTFLIHRLIAIHFIENPIPTEYNMVDHINRVKTDNRIDNLRWCNQSLNNRNMKKRKNTSSKFKGVILDKRDNKWQSEIKINKVRKCLGRHFTEEEAAKAYNQYIIDNKLEEFFILNDI